MKHLAPAAAALGLLLAASSAGAQFGGIFGGPPRPPGDVPGRGTFRQPPPPPEALPPPLPPEEADQEPPGNTPPPIIRSQPLPPPPGTAPNDLRAPVQQGALPRPGAAPGQPAQAPLTGLPPGQRQPRGTPQPADTSAQPGDEVVTEAPSVKIANPTAVFSGLDKITGRIISFDVALNETVQFGALQVTPRVCYSRPPTEPSRTDAFVEVDEVTLQGEVKRIFDGWMFAASPGLHGVEHPIYDVWLTDCKGGATTAPTASADAPAKPATPSRPSNSRSNSRSSQPRR